MKHIILNNGTTIRREKQAAEEFITVHELHKEVKNDLDTLKLAIKDNDGFAWYRHGIAVKYQPTVSFDKAGAIKLLRKLGATEDQISKLTTSGKVKRVSLAK